MTKEEIGHILKDLRIKTGKTQKDVAVMLGRNQQIVGHWETGYSQPDANTLFELCSIYGVTVDEAFGFERKHYKISLHDQKMLDAYSKQPQAVQKAVDRMLGVPDEPLQKQNEMETAADISSLADKDVRDIAKSNHKA